ncbi:MAG: FxsA family protein, partial [Pseudomonadota bacterium]|nr:FxsA family protein [Pseudomonadota bacterium]
LLITPGFVTDFVGFTLLFPPSRIVIAKGLMSRVMMNGAVSADIHAAQFRAQGQKPNEDPSALDGEFQRKD